MTPNSRETIHEDSTQVTPTSRQTVRVKSTPVSPSKHLHNNRPVLKIPTAGKRRKQSAHLVPHKENTIVRKKAYRNMEYSYPMKLFKVYELKAEKKVN
jgi:hypothetical protein